MKVRILSSTKAASWNASRLFLNLRTGPGHMFLTQQCQDSLTPISICPKLQRFPLVGSDFKVPCWILIYLIYIYTICIFFISIYIYLSMHTHVYHVYNYTCLLLLKYTSTSTAKEGLYSPIWWISAMKGPLSHRWAYPTLHQGGLWGTTTVGVRRRLVAEVCFL